MSNTYIISANKTTEAEGKGTKANPFKFTRPTLDFKKVQTISLDKCYVQMIEFNNDESLLQKIEGGYFSNTNGNTMFQNCKNLTTFNSNLDALTVGTWMFANCTALTSFNVNLPNLVNGNEMFSGCGFSNFSVNLSSVTDGGYMFQECHNLTSFTSNLSSLQNGELMFYKSGLKSFNIPLTNVTNAGTMFSECENLTSFNNVMPNCLSINNMFKNSGIKDCELEVTGITDVLSVAGAFDGIPDDFNQIKIGVNATVFAAETASSLRGRLGLKSTVTNMSKETDGDISWYTFKSANA